MSKAIVNTLLFNRKTKATYRFDNPDEKNPAIRNVYIAQGAFDNRIAPLGIKVTIEPLTDEEARDLNPGYDDPHVIGKEDGSGEDID